jgi:hypothetical protein
LKAPLIARTSMPRSTPSDRIHYTIAVVLTVEGIDPTTECGEASAPMGVPKIVICPGRANACTVETLDRGLEQFVCIDRDQPSRTRRGTADGVPHRVQPPDPGRTIEAILERHQSLDFGFTHAWAEKS